MKKTFANILYIVFLLLSYSNNLRLSNSKSELQVFNQIDYKNEEEKKIINPDIIINITYDDNQNSIKVGNKGTLYFITDYNDNELNIFDSSDIEEKTAFQTFCTERRTKGNFTLSCRLWKPSYGNLKLFCKLNDFFTNGYHSILINNTIFNYRSYSILVNFIGSFGFNQLKYYPFLYSDEQIINIEDEKDLYLLKFNIESFSEDIIFIGGKFLNRKFLTNYKVKEKELICEIKKEDLVEILPVNGGNLFLYFYWIRELYERNEIQQLSNVF